MGPLTPLVVRQARPVPLPIALAEYRRILEQLPRDRADALRLAQLKVREQYPNPRYWAAFVLIGEGDRAIDF
jgi:hypothetical protein